MSAQTEAERGRLDGLRGISPAEGAGLARDASYWPAHRDGARMLLMLERAAGTTLEAVRKSLEEAA